MRVVKMVDTNRLHIPSFLLIAATTLLFWSVFPPFKTGATMEINDVITLPQPDTKGSIPLEQTLLKRRSVRNFKDIPLSLKNISQLIWSAQGITDKRGYRTAPSAGALYPLEVYVIVGKVDGLMPGIYQYLPGKHELKTIKTGDFRNELWKAGLHQTPIRQAPATILTSCVFKRITGKYGKRGIQYAFIEAGHAGQSILLQAVSLGLGGVPIGAFHDPEVSHVMGFNEDEVPLYLIPMGIPNDN
jgi:SagB-type dehydrogenase family enzyme